MTLESLAEIAHSRAHAGLSYAGEVSPKEVWDFLSADSRAMLVDVRTPPEWAEGRPDLQEIGKSPLMIQWKLYPNYVLNENFSQELSKVVSEKDTALFFLCRTGGRSLDAAVAMTGQGYRYCFNVTDGFEGPLDANNQRGTVAGWKATKLPWRQG